MDIHTVISILFFLLILWYLFYLAGTFQFRHIQKKTREIVLKYANLAMEGKLDRSYEKLYEACYPEWCEMVENSAVFIPNKSELIPVKATVENVKKRINFTPGSMKTFLKEYKIKF